MGALSRGTEHEHVHIHDYSTRTHPEYVAIDIGGELGALILRTEPGMHGVEVEISRTGHDDERSHKQVLARGADGEPQYTAVFDALRAGRYTLWVDDEPRSRGVHVAAGEVAEVDWRVQTAAQAA